VRGDWGNGPARTLDSSSLWERSFLRCSVSAVRRRTDSSDSLDIPAVRLADQAKGEKEEEEGEREREREL
jgi:hypothetical protein